MKFIIALLTVMLFIVGVTANPLLGGKTQMIGGLGGAVAGAMSDRDRATCKLVSELTANLNVIVQPVISITSQLETMNGSSVQSVVSTLNELSGSIATTLTRTTTIISGTKSIASDLIKNLNAAIGKVGIALVKIVQAINIACEAGPIVSSLDGITAIVEGTAASLIDAINALIESDVTAIEPLIANATTADVKSIASVQLVLQSNLKIVWKVLASAQNIISSITSNASAPLSTFMSAVDQARSSVSGIVSQLSIEASVAIKEIVPSLNSIASELSSNVSSVVSSVREGLISACGNVSNIIGSVPDAAAIISSLHRLGNPLTKLLSEVAAAVRGVFDNIEAAIHCIATSLQGIIRANSALNNAIGSVVAIIVSLTEESCQNAGAINGIADQLNNALNALVASAQGVISSILPTIDGSISAQLAAVLEQIVCAVVALVQLVAGAVAGTLENIRAPPIEQIAGNLSGIISGTLNQLLTSINGANLNDFLNNLSSSVSALAGNSTESLSVSLRAVYQSPFGVIGSLAGCLDGVSGVLMNILKGTVRQISEVVAEIGTTGTVTDASKAATALSFLACNVNVIVNDLGGILSSSGNIGSH